MWNVILKILVLIVIFTDLIGYLIGIINRYKNEEVKLGGILGVLVGTLLRTVALYLIWV